jgi:hypothetical protein
MIDDDEIRALVTRLARPRAGGGHVIERAAILASGADSGAVEAWILAHSGEPESVAAPVHAPGLHGDRIRGTRASDSAPRRFLLPASALTRTRPTVTVPADQESAHAREKSHDHVLEHGQTPPERR